MILGYDTECSGLLRDELDPMDPQQPAMCQLGAKLYDVGRKKVGHLSVLIKPDGWSIEPQAEAKHGISTERCERYGVELGEALVLFRALVRNATRIVAHHQNYDRRIIALSIRRVGGEGLWWAKKATALYCSMESAAPACGLPGPIPGEAKYPSLEEAHSILCPTKTFVSRHDADTDIDAMMDVYWALVDRGIAKNPELFARRR